MTRNHPVKANSAEKPRFAASQVENRAQSFQWLAADMQTMPGTIRMDDRYVYSASGARYERTRPRDRNHVHERRLPYIKMTMAKGRPYYYFNGPNRSVSLRLPDVGDVGFDHAYLCALADLEGCERPNFILPLRSVVYFISVPSGPIKIGFANRVERRVATMQVHNHEQLTVRATVVGTYQDEYAYHRRFAEHRIRGEWFSPHPDILAEIERINAEVVV